jgi:hypothetical protein
MWRVGCFVLVFALISPRLALIFTWLFSDVLSRSMDGWLVPFIGFFILPWTTLSYAWMWYSGRTVDGFEWFLVAFAFLLDIGAFGAGARTRARGD